jgi:NAD(P)H dehydrogenase (quinone)
VHVARRHGRAVTRIAVIYYSATGNVHALARAVAEGAADEGAEVRLRHVAELTPEMLISFKQHWGRHRSELEDQPDAALEDLEWADGIAFGTPTRFGNVSAQLKVFLDLAGELWERGALVDKVATSFTSSQTVHGGQESTILALNNTFYHWGAIVLPLGYTVHEVFNGGGNPYGASYTSDHHVDGQPGAEALMVARAQGARLARVTSVIAAARAAGLLTARAPGGIDERRGELSALRGQVSGPFLSDQAPSSWPRLSTQENCSTQTWSRSANIGLEPPAQMMTRRGGLLGTGAPVAMRAARMVRCPRDRLLPAGSAGCHG